MQYLPPHHIEAVSVNHNTSPYMELMLRSLFARHPAGLNFSVTILDNASQDDLAGLSAYAARKQVQILPSGFTTATMNNSHGEVLRRFVLDRPNCTHYLFLDADVCFVEDRTLHTMLAELEQAQGTFGSARGCRGMASTRYRRRCARPTRISVTPGYIRAAH